MSSIVLFCIQSGLAAVLLVQTVKLFILLKSTDNRPDAISAIEELHSISTGFILLTCFVGSAFFLSMHVTTMIIGECIPVTIYRVLEELSKLMVVTGGVLFLHHIINEETPGHPFYKLKHGREENHG